MASDGAESEPGAVVGLGASAGGLEACDRFFANVPPRTGLAFVLVSHLDPRSKSMMVELLAKRAQIPVRQAENGQRVEPDQVYVAPPGARLTLRQGRLHLAMEEHQRSPALPVDSFLRSLADDRGPDAICIILSGTGTDGTLGLKAVKEAGGMTMAQDERSAKYPGMPRSAITTGLVDYVLPVEEMPRVLLGYAGRLAAARQEDHGSSRGDDIAAHLGRIFLLVRNRTGHDFSHYKKNTILRRIDRRMQLLHIEHASDYLAHLRQNSAAIDALFKDLLIGVTHFFRDPKAFAALGETAISELLARRQGEQPLRVWVPGCATGEEAYSLAILLAENMSSAGVHVPVQIFATDIDEATLDFARAGIFPDSIVADVSAERLERFFDHHGSTYLIRKKIRDMIVFSIHNLIKDPPFSKLDLISCRNVLIYFGPELQKRLLPLFHYALLPHGFLFLGPSETVGAATDLFSARDKKAKIFARETALRREPVEFPVSLVHRPRPEPLPPPPATASLTTIVRRLLLERYGPACAVIDSRCDVVYFHGHTGKYLEAPPGAPDLNVVRMARHGLRLKLRTAIHRAAKMRRPVVEEGVRVRTHHGGTQRIDLTVHPITELGLEPGLMLVTFEDAGEAAAEAETLDAPADGTPEEAAVHQLERELLSTREHLRTTVEELETANEELKSSNEELLSMNEELQSTNEELETSKEELQSVNEELETVNAELTAKVAELARANSDMQNLLSSTQIATIFLDDELRIKSFTPAITEIFHLIASDVGRPITDIAQRITYADLSSDVAKVLRTLSGCEREVMTRDGEQFIMRMLPYRTVDNVIDGVVITFVGDFERS